MVEISNPAFEASPGILRLKLPLTHLESYGIKCQSFNGAVIDGETDEQRFLDNLKGAHRFKNHMPVCFGFLDKDWVEVIARTDRDSDGYFVKAVDERLRQTASPYYAFNAACDMSLLSKLLNKEVPFHGELQQWERQKKEYLRRDLRIPSCGDPFNGEGFLAAKEWTNYLETSDINCVKRIMAHNFSCLSTEYNILQKKGYRIIEQNSCKTFLEGKNDLVCSKV